MRGVSMTNGTRQSVYKFIYLFILMMDILNLIKEGIILNKSLAKTNHSFVR